MADNSTNEEDQIREKLICQKMLNDELFQVINESLESFIANSRKDINELKDLILQLEVQLKHIETIFPPSLNKSLISDCNIKGVMDACDKGVLPALQYYFEVGEDSLRRGLTGVNSVLGARDDENQTLLMVAATNGYLNIVEYLVDKGIEIDHVDINMRTALNYAIEYDEKNIVEFLAVNGADVNKIIHEDTYLHRAIELDNLPIVEILVSKGHSLSVRNYLDKTPIEYATLLSRTQIESFFKNYS